MIRYGLGVLGRLFVGARPEVPALRVAAVCPPSVAAEQESPRLWVWRVCPGRWLWSLIGPHAETLDSGDTTTWAEALAVGLAALERLSLVASASATGQRRPTSGR